MDNNDHTEEVIQKVPEAVRLIFLIFIGLLGLALLIGMFLSIAPTTGYVEDDPTARYQMMRW